MTGVLQREKRTFLKLKEPSSLLVFCKVFVSGNYRDEGSVLSHLTSQVIRPNYFYSYNLRIFMHSYLSFSS